MDELIRNELRAEYFTTHEKLNPKSRFYGPRWDKEVMEILGSKPKSEVTQKHRNLVQNKFCLLDLGVIASSLRDIDSQDIRLFLEN